VTRQAPLTSSGTRAAALGLACALCLVAGSTPRAVGDGVQYVVQALNFSRGGGPAITGADLAVLDADAARLAPEMAGWTVAAHSVEDARGRHDFLHFWFYALIATPFVGAAAAVGVTPLAGFVGLNLALFTLALLLAAPRVGWPAALLLFAGPVVWWLDKPHTEIFTFSLLVVAMACLAERPWWSLVAAGAAALQNPPVAALLVLIPAGLFARGTNVVGDRRVLAGFAAGLALAAAHPVYTYARHGVASLLFRGATSGVPQLAEILAPLTDPTIGLVANYPAFVAAVGAGAVLLMRPGAERRDVDVIVGVVAAVIFLLAFARTGNFHHGATPSMSRYALWLVPLSVPLFARLAETPRAVWGRGLPALAVASAAVSVFVFHPAVPEHGREPTLLGTTLWTRAPEWSNPLSEIFEETLTASDDPAMPVRTAGCEKILTVGRGDDGVWPVPCYPAPLSAECRPRGVYCYANRGAAGYSFAPAPGRRPDAGVIDRSRVWPAASEPAVRQIFEDMNWETLAHDGPDAARLRAAHQVGAWVLAAPDRLLVVLWQPAEGAVLRLRLPGPMTGRLHDIRGLEIIAELDYGDTGDVLRELRVPATTDLLILTLRTRGAA
jgi:hypothetical protein